MLPAVDDDDDDDDNDGDDEDDSDDDDEEEDEEDMCSPAVLFQAVHRGDVVRRNLRV